MADFFWPADATRGHLGRHASEHRIRGGASRLGLGLREAREAGSMRGAWQDIVHGDAVDGHFGGPRFGPIGHGSANGVRHAQPRQWGLDRRADDIHNPSKSCALHAGKHRLGQDLVVDEVLVERGQKCVFISFRDRTSCRSSAVVHQDVHVARSEHLGGCSTDFFWVLEVGHSHCMTVTRKGGQRLVQAVPVPRQKRDLGAESGQLLSRGEADSLRCATHQGALATQIQGQNMQVTHAAKGRQEAYF